MLRRIVEWGRRGRYKGHAMLTDGLARLWSAWKQLKLVTLSCCFPFVWFSYVLWPSFSQISFPNKSFTNPFGTFGRHKFFRWLHSFWTTITKQGGGNRLLVLNSYNKIKIKHWEEESVSLRALRWVAERGYDCVMKCRT